MSIFKVTFHRTYTIEVVETGNKDYTNEELEAQAEKIARDYLSEEMPEFLDNTEDFVSATVEKII